ncbi:MAG: class D sortase [Candidatus Eisenbacteria bacterium]
MLPLRGRTLDRRFLYLAASWLLFVGGCVLVGLWALATLDTRLYQHQQSAALERAIAARFAAAGEGPSASAVRVGPADAARAAADAGGVIGRIAAPRLGISAIIAEGIDKRTLRRAVGHVPGTAFPGEEGNVGLAGHRDSFFRGLKDVCADDSLTLTTPDGDFHYRVESTEIVDPDRGDVLASEGGATLTLVTCYPFFYVGHAPSRFIVRARLISADRPYEAPMPPPKQYTPEEMTSVEDPAPPPAT